MTTEKYLTRLSWLTNTITSRLERLAMERGRAINMVAPTDSDPVQTSAKDTLCEIMSSVVDMDAELNGYVSEYKLIISQIDGLTAPYAPAYLFRRYGRGQTVREIASDMRISRSTVYRVHREAFEEFEEKWGKSYLTTEKISVMEQKETL